MRVRIDEAGEDDAAAEVESARATGFAEAFDPAARADGGDASIVNEKRTIANDGKIVECAATTGRSSAKSEELGASGDQQIGCLVTFVDWRHATERY